MARWTLLNAVGLAAGLAGGLIVGMLLGELVNAMLVTAAVTCAVGSGLGAFQALGLRQGMRRSLAWIVATTIGIGVGLALGVVLVEQIGIFATGQRPNIARLGVAYRALSLVAVGLVAGTAVGCAQWFLMKGRHWIPICGFGLAIAFAASSFLIDLAGFGIASAPGFLTFVIASGLIFGAVTAHGRNVPHGRY